MCMIILNQNQKCEHCNVPLTNDEIDRHLKIYGFIGICFKCLYELA
jgi:hypothetical protein